MYTKLHASCILLCFQVFREVAYKAKTREDIMHGMDEFLDQVTVLPPGQWDPEIRIDPPTSVPSQVNTTILFFVNIYLFVHVSDYHPSSFYIS